MFIPDYSPHFSFCLLNQVQTIRFSTIRKVLFHKVSFVNDCFFRTFHYFCSINDNNAIIYNKV